MTHPLMIRSLLYVLVFRISYPVPLLYYHCKRRVHLNQLRGSYNKKCLFICCRATYLFPHQQLGIVGHHSLSVEALDISHDGEFVASSSVDQTLKFWPISYFEDSNFLSSLNKTNNQRNLPSSNVVDRADFFSGLA